jgi:hypothetical protein
MYLQEVKHFFRCTEGMEEPIVGLEDGQRLTELIMKIKESSEKRRFISV